MEEAFTAASFASASCLSFILASNSRSFLTKYSSSLAFFLSSHLFATIILPPNSQRRLCQRLTQPLDRPSHRLFRGLHVRHMLAGWIIEKRMPGAVIQFNLVLFFILVQRLTKHHDFGFRRSEVCGAVMA